MKTLIRSLLMFGVFLVLAACGGGGGGGEGGGGSATPAKAWGTAVFMDNGGASPASDPQIAIDAAGNAIAVWSQYDGTPRNNIWANRYTATTGTWGTAALIETDDTGDASFPQIAVDAGGNAIAVWHHFNGAIYSMWANRYIPPGKGGSGWGTAAGIDIDLTNGSSRGAPQLAINAGGNAIAVWIRGENTILSIYAVRYVPGTGWGMPTLIETGTGVASSPQIAIDAVGNAIAVWRQLGNIYANRYDVVTGWGTATLIETDNASASSPQIAVDAGGNAIAVWSQLGNIYANRYDVVTGWGTATLIETDNASASSPQIAVDAGGNAIAVWEQPPQDFPPYINIWANRYNVTTGLWGTATLIETDNAGSASSPQIAVDGSGNAIAVWYQFDNTRYNIYANRYVLGSGWGAAVPIENNVLGNAKSPQIAVDGSGNAIAVWEQDTPPIFTNIRANRYQ